ncbi:MAG: hypothetical protein M1814_005869 [Vezdaea aestivalis]|nr:MAG: hypothetical protein M1814_005869 [Vezdaea aestivalis]
MAGTGGGGAGGPESHQQGGQPLGTEYTLQGVMRFLQMEWHRHERDRNAWEIERAEMKAKIARQEGDGRTGKKISESLSTHVKMLEKALRAERERQKAAASIDKDSLAVSSKTESENADSKVKILLKETQASLLKGKKTAGQKDGQDEGDQEQEAAGGRVRGFMDKTMQEVTYLLVPPINPPPQSAQSIQETPAGQAFPSTASPQGAFKEGFGQQQSHNNDLLQPNLQFNQSVPTTNHHPPPVPSVPGLSVGLNPSNATHTTAQMTRSFHDPSSLNRPKPLQGLALPEELSMQPSHPSSSFPLATDEPVEKYTHAYDQMGRQISSRQEEHTTGLRGAPSPRTPDSHVEVDADAWDFDDPTSKSPDISSDAPPQRPDTDAFPISNHVTKSSPRLSPSSHRRKGSMSRRRSDGSHEIREFGAANSKPDSSNFKVRFALRGHLDVVRSVIFTGGGSPSEPEICSTGDDGVIKRWIIPATYHTYGSQSSNPNDLDIQSYFTHRGHIGAVTCLAACSSAQSISSGGRALGDGWIFSGGQDSTIRVWERGRVDPKATILGHGDSIWAISVLPGSCCSVFGSDAQRFGGPERILLASGSADGSVRIWAVSAPPQLTSPQTGSRRGVGGSRRHSISSGSNFPSSPQPSTATSTPFNYILVHTITRSDSTASPTYIAPLSANGDTFAVSYTDAAVVIFDTRNGEEVVGMTSTETYNGEADTGVNAVVATTVGLEGSLSTENSRTATDDDGVMHGATGSSTGVEGVVISGHEDRYIRFFDANSGQCTYTMLAHPSAISALSLSPDGRELVSAGHDASLRFWSLEKRACTQEITSHRLMRGEGVCSVEWSQDGRWVVSAGGDGVVKVFAR